MLGFARLWAVTALIAGAVGENQCHDDECIAPSVAGDENSLLQKAEAQHLGRQVGEGPGYGLLQFNLAKCAESFACGAISGKIGSKLGGFKGVVAGGATVVSCSALSDVATGYFKHEDIKKLALEAHKAQGCFHTKSLDLVLTCAHKILAMEEQKAAAFGLDLNTYQELGKAKTLCTSMIAPNGKVNLTVSSELYKKCGFPGLAQKIVASKKPAGSAAMLEAQACQVAGMAAVALHNFLKTKKTVKAEVMEDDQEATEEENGVEPEENNGGGPEAPAEEPQPEEVMPEEVMPENIEPFSEPIATEGTEIAEELPSIFEDAAFE